MPSRFWCLLLFGALAFAQSAPESSVSPELLLLARVRVVMDQNLHQLPNYTCRLTVERSRRTVRDRKFSFRDALRLEVALVDGKELFSWPGEKQFREGQLTDMIGEGAISTGSFALHARSVFLSRSAEIKYAGKETLGGQDSVRFDFHIPQYRSGYQIQVGTESGVAGEHGSFWVDPVSLDLMRLLVVAEDIPPNVPLREAQEALEYSRVSIGASTFLLPKTAELIMTDLNGDTSRNWTTFSDCHQYSGESVLTFDEAPDADNAGATNASQPANAKSLQLPPRMTLDLDLVTPIDCRHSAIGDPLMFSVRKTASRSGVVIPKGTQMRARIVRFEWRHGERLEYAVVGIRFADVELPSGHAALHGELLRASTYQVFGQPVSSLITSGYRANETIQSYNDQPRDGEGVFYVPVDVGIIPQGASFAWRTAEAPQPER